MNQTRITFADEAATTRLTISPIGLQGVPGPQGVPGLANIRAVSVHGTDALLTSDESVVVFTATATATLPPATGSGLTYRLVCRAGTLTIDPNGAETVKGASTAALSAGEDLILTDTAAGVWE